MITLFYLFIIQLLGGFLVVLGTEHFKNPSGSILRRSFNRIKIYFQEPYDKISLVLRYITCNINIFLSLLRFVIFMAITSLFLSFIANFTMGYLSELNLDDSKNYAEGLFWYYIFLYYIFPVCIYAVLMRFVYFVLETTFQERGRITFKDDSIKAIEVKAETST